MTTYNIHPTDDLWWYRYTHMEVDDTDTYVDQLIGQEKYNFDRFYRQYNTFRMGHFNNRVLTLPKSIQLPTNSIIHVLDDVTRVTHKDTPDLDTIELVTRESFKRYIHHVRDFNLEGPVTLEEKYIYRTGGLPSILLKYKADNDRFIKTVPLMESLPSKHECLLVINHDPLFRVIVMGRMKEFRRYQLILTSIVNTICQLATLPNTESKQQYLLIPWTDETYSKMMFVRNRTSLDLNSVKYPTSFHYLIMMHLLNFCWQGATTSIFSPIPDELRSKITIVLNNRDYYVFYNLKDLYELAEGNKSYLRMVNQMNTLSLLGIAKDSKDATIVNKIHSTIQEEDEILIEDDEAEPVATYDVVDDKFQDATQDGEERKSDILDNVISTVQHKIKDITLPKATPDKALDLAPHDLYTKVTVTKDDKTQGVVVTKESKSLPPVMNIPVTYKTTQEEESRINRDMLEDRERETIEFIDKQEHLTPAQKERYKRMSHAWEKLELDGVTLYDLISKHTDTSLIDTTIPDIVGDLPDEGAKSSVAYSLDKSYMKNLYNQHLAGVITSFNCVGAYLKDLKVVKTLNEMHNYKTYSLKFEDIYGKESTVKFTIPTVDRMGRIKVDGTKQVLKKQRVDLPIVKIDDTTVGLASNYNKTRVERNTNKAHNFFSYIDKMFKGSNRVSIEYGSSVLNLPLSYEYTSLAERYKTVTIHTKEHGDLEYCFNYSNRLEHSQLSDKDLTTLESQYGVYLGKCGKSRYFISTDNIVSIVDGQGEVGTTTFLGLLSDLTGWSYKPLTEWVSCKILDKHLPVIFILAYQWGLQKTLNAIGLKYVVIESRSKVIIGGSDISGTENYGYTGGDVASGAYNDTEYYGEDWIQHQDGSGTTRTIVPNEEVIRYDRGTENLDLAPIVNKPTVDITKIKDIDVLLSQNLDMTKVIVGGSSSLVAWGIYPPLSNHDIDVAIEPAYLQQLVDEGKVEILPLEGTNLKTYQLKGTEIDLGIVGREAIITFEGLQEMGIMTVDGVQLLNIYGLYKFYYLLICNPPSEKHKAKWLKHIEVMNQVVSSWNNHITYHVSPVQGIREFTPTRYKTPDDSAPARIYSSYFLSFALCFGIDWTDSQANQSWTIDEHDGFIPHLVFTNKTLTLEDCTKPCSVYIFDDKPFDHLYHIEGKDYGHPILEMVTEESVKPIREYRFDNWLHAMYELEEQGDITLVNFHELESDAPDTSKLTRRAQDLSVPLDNIQSLLTKASSPVAAVSTTTKSERRYIAQPDDIRIRFNGKTLIFNRYPIKASLIASGLDMYDLSSYNLEEFESKDIYYQLLHDKSMSTNYLKGISSFFDLFVDPMTYQELKRMREPTEFGALLIRSAELLSTTDHMSASSAMSHRLRGYEQFNAVLYNSLARAFAAYQSRRGRANAFTINPDDVYLKLVSNASLVPCDSSNPLQDIKETTSMTHAGAGGRSAESFVLEDRKFYVDNTGIISEATADSGKVAINAMLSFNPKIDDANGRTSEPIDIPKLDPSNIFSIYVLTFPFGNMDDPSRVNFLSIQSSHLVPVDQTSAWRVRTGYERTIAHRCSKIYAGVAEQDGKIVDVDEESKLMTIEYKDKSRDVFPIGDNYQEAGGITVAHKLIPIVKVGDKVSKGAILTYNPSYFHRDYQTNQLDFSLGVAANVAFLETDTTVEDSVDISRKLADKLTIHPVNQRVVTITKNSTIHKVANIGDHVLNTDPLLIFEESMSDDVGFAYQTDETMSLLSDLNRRTPNARFNGVIVDIKAYYGCEISEMHPSLQALVKNCNKFTNRRAKIAKGTLDSDEYPSCAPMDEGQKYKGVYFDKDTVSLVFSIQESIPHGVGDKLIVANQLKSVCSNIFQHPIYSESGVEVDCLFSSDGAGRRICTSQWFMGVSARIMEKIEQDIVDMYFS